MKTILILISLAFFASCTTMHETANVNTQNFNFKNEINNSIIDGFYDNDTTKIPKNAYFIK